MKVKVVQIPYQTPNGVVTLYGSVISKDTPINIGDTVTDEKTNDKHIVAKITALNGDQKLILLAR